MNDLNTHLVTAEGVPDWLWEQGGVLYGDRDYHLQIYETEFILRGVTDGIVAHLTHLDMGPSSITLKHRRTIDVFRSPHPQFNNTGLSGFEYTVRFAVRDKTIRFHGYYFAGGFDTDSGAITCYLAPAGDQTLAAEVENFLRVAASLHFHFSDVFLFHSAAVHIEGHTFVFFGPHGAGKSTIALKAPREAVVLGDDLNALIVKADRLWVASLPFPSEVMTTRPIVEYPVTAMFRLVKDKVNFFEPLSHGEKLAVLFGSLPVFNWLPGNLMTDQTAIHALLDRVELYRLHFSKEGDIYPWLLQNLASDPR